METQIEALLFMKGEPLTRKELSKITKASLEEVEVALSRLSEALSSRGIRLVQKDDEVMLATSPEFASFFADLERDEQSRDLGKAGLETLSIILYYGPVSKSRIEYIRGVNSSFVLRTLLIRGLVERIPNPEDQRGYLYRATFDTFSHLGITDVHELPEYETIKSQVEAVVAPEEILLPDEFDEHGDDESQ